MEESKTVFNSDKPLTKREGLVPHHRIKTTGPGAANIVEPTEDATKRETESGSQGGVPSSIFKKVNFANFSDIRTILCIPQ